MKTLIRRTSTSLALAFHRSSAQADYGVAGWPAERSERVLAVGRAFLTVAALIAIYLDPTEPARFAAVTYGVLLAYAAYSVIVLVRVHTAARVSPTHGLWLHASDILWSSVLTFISEGPVSPFFLFFLFAVLAAAYRWGFRETMATTVLTIVIFLTDTAIASVSGWNSRWFGSIEFELNRMILRVAYLLLTGFLFGYLAEQEKTSRRELATIAAAARQPRVDIGLGSHVMAVMDSLLATFGASSATVVVEQQETREALLWHRDSRLASTPSDPNRVSLTLSATQRSDWLFPTPGRTWHAARQNREDWVWRVAEAGAWRLRRVHADLPETIGHAHGYSTVTATDIGLAGEWHGRIYLFDVRPVGSVERRLHFLEALTDHITPGVTNVLLLRRLRSQAGASERARVARELHDGAIQSLFGIEMQVEALRRKSGASPSTVGAGLSAIQAMLRQEILALRELMQAIRPMEIESGDDLAGVLAGVVEKFRRDTSISARFVSTGGPVRLHRTAALELVRIVQEALVNVRKHSRASNVLIRLARRTDGTELIVEDDGCGFEFDGHVSGVELDRRRVGPAIIKERARTIGAVLAIDSKPGLGARIELVFGEETYG